MKIHRFIIDDQLPEQADFKKQKIELIGDVAHQIIKVLKLKISEKIELCDGQKNCAITEIIEINKNKVIVKLDTLLRPVNFEGQQNTKQVHLFCAVLKKENFELVVQKATECGISKITPIITERTIKTGLNLERLKKISKEASEQSRRIDIPEISEIIFFSKAIENNAGKNIIFDSSGELFYKMPWERDGASTRNFSAEKYPCVLESNSPQTSNKNLWIGPEGGWTQKELKLAKENNFKILSLGPLTLRAETAAIIGTYLVLNC